MAKEKDITEKQLEALDDVFADMINALVFNGRQVVKEDELKPFLNDYRLNVIDIAYLTPEQVRLFKSDFRIVADYFVQSRISGDYIPSPEKLTHVDEVLKLMAALTRDDRFIHVVNNSGLLRSEEGGISMCEVLDKVEQRGFAAGQAKGKAEGKAERDSFYGKLMQLLAPLGRLDELIAATSDQAKLASLAKEFGLEI